MNFDNKVKPNKPINPEDVEEWQKESLDSKFGSEIFHPPANPGTFKPMEEGGKIAEKHRHKKKKKKSKESAKQTKMKSPDTNGFGFALGRITIESSDSKASSESNNKRPSLISATKSKDSKKKKKKKSKSPCVHKSSSVGPNDSKRSVTSRDKKHQKKSRLSSSNGFSSLSRSKSTESANKHKIHVKVTTPADSNPYGPSTESISDYEGPKKKSRSNVSNPCKTGLLSQSKSQDGQLTTKKSNKSSGDQKRTPLIDAKPYGSVRGFSSQSDTNSQDSQNRKGVKSASEFRFTISSKMNGLNSGPISSSKEDKKNHKPRSIGNSSATESKFKEVHSGNKNLSSVYYNQKNPLHVTHRHNGTSEGSSSYLITATISKDFEHKKSAKHASGQLVVGKISTSGGNYASKESPDSDNQGPEKKKKNSPRSESFEKTSLVVHVENPKVLYTEKMIKSVEVFLASKTARSCEFNAPKKCSHSKATQPAKNNCPTFSSTPSNSFTWIQSTGEETKKKNKSSGLLSGSKSEENQTNERNGSSISNHPKVDTFQPFGPRASEGTLGDSVPSLMPKLPPYMSESETGTHLHLSEEHPYGHSPSGEFVENSINNCTPFNNTLFSESRDI